MQPNKKSFVLVQLLLLSFFFAARISSQNTAKQLLTDANGYSYQSFENDPIDLRLYTLKNGMKVYLAPSQDEPRIRTSIMVKSGSKHDPADATGLAHYLEHLLFKGTDRLGTLDYEKEAPYLQKIEALFEKRRQTSDVEEKNRIYKKIDSLSQAASKYALSKEYNNIMSEMGAWRVNAFTTFDRTGYISNIPANYLEKWLTLEAERFRNPTFRTFHTELETVYEEMNTIIDDGPRYALFQMYETLFSKHQYGHQTAIGKIEHLKNPSLTEIKKYFDTYYVPNNMAIMLCGDFDPDEAIQLVVAHFGSMQRQELPKLITPNEPPLNRPAVKHIEAPGTEMLRMGFRFKGHGTDDALMVKLIDMIVMNGRAGIFDLNINKAQKAQQVSTFVDGLKDYSIHVITGFPKEGQSLTELKDLILQEIEHVKTGNFPDWLVEAVINDLKQIYMRTLESNDGKSGLLIESYSFDIPWNEQIAEIEKLNQITKADIMAFAKKNYKNNYAVVYKKTGLESDVKRIEKPGITPIALNEEKESAFKQKIDGIKSESVKPRFLHFDQDIEKRQLHNGTTVNIIKNTTNELFTLNLDFDLSQNNDKLLDLAVDYLPFAGTGTYTAAEIEEEFYKLGCSFSINTNSFTTSIFLSGLTENFEKALELFDHVLTNIQADEAALETLRNKIFKERSDWKKSKNEIRRWLTNYGLYGSDSPYKNVFSEQELHNIKATELAEKIRTLMNHEHRIFYYGPHASLDLKTILNKKLEKRSKLIPVKKDRRFTNKVYHSNNVCIAEAETKQIDIVLLSNLKPFHPDVIGMVYLFNQYFTDLFFQELREARALAYSAYCGIDIPSSSDRSYQLYAFVGTQSDKYAEAIEAAHNLIYNMPLNASGFENAKKAMMEKISSERIVKFNILNEYDLATKRGLDYDLRKDVYEAIPNISLNDFQKFYESLIKDNPFSLLIVGDKNEIDPEQLKKYGKPQFLSHEEVFGF